MRLIIYKVLQNIENIKGISHWTKLRCTSSNISERSLTGVQTLLWIWVYRYTLFSSWAADSCPPSAEVYLSIQENSTWKRQSAIRHMEIFHTVGTRWSTQRTYWNNFWGWWGGSANKGTCWVRPWSPHSRRREPTLQVWPSRAWIVHICVHT